MKKLFYVLPGLCLFASGAAAETIDSVSFNPARLGRYETLKVSDQLTTKGGIEANAVTVQSGGTVSVNNAGNYKFPVTEVLGSVDMKSTDFEAGTLNSRGTASFENKSSSAESMITTLNTSTADVRANILDLTNVTVPDEDENSLRLGENNIPRPASVGLDNCSNLTWVERTTDDNYKYKVLAFGTCAGGDDDCKESYGTWMTFAGTKTDTCNGSTTAQYTCTGTAKTCVDVYITSSGSSGNKYGSATSATYTTKDTCDGDIYDKFTGTPSGTSCVDVYADTSASTIESSTICPNGHNQRPITSCNAYTEANASTSGYQYVANHGIEAFCRDKILPNNPNGCQAGFSQSTTDPVSGQFRCGRPYYAGRYWGAYHCVVSYYKRTVSKGSSSSSRKYRNVTCCDGGGSGGDFGTVTLPPVEGCDCSGCVSTGEIATTVCPPCCYKADISQGWLN